MEQGKCGLCGEPMPKGEEMFMYHGNSGPCSKPMLPKAEVKKPVFSFKEEHGPSGAIYLDEKCLFLLNKEDDHETVIFQCQAIFDRGAKWAREKAVKDGL